MGCVMVVIGTPWGVVGTNVGAGVGLVKSRGRPIDTDAGAWLDPSCDGTQPCPELIVGTLVGASEGEPRYLNTFMYAFVAPVTKLASAPGCEVPLPEDTSTKLALAGELWSLPLAARQFRASSRACWEA